MAPDVLARFGFDARGNAIVIDHEDQVVHQQYRWLAGDIALDLPDHVRVGHDAVPARANRPQLRAPKATACKDQAMTNDGASTAGVAVAVFRVPDFSTAGRVIGIKRLGAEA